MHGLCLFFHSFSHFRFHLIPSCLSIFTSSSLAGHSRHQTASLSCSLGKITPSDLISEKLSLYVRGRRDGSEIRTTVLIITFLTAFAWESDLRCNSDKQSFATDLQEPRKIFTVSM